MTFPKAVLFSSREASDGQLTLSWAWGAAPPGSPAGRQRLPLKMDRAAVASSPGVILTNDTHTLNYLGEQSGPRQLVQRDG